MATAAQAAPPRTTTGAPGSVDLELELLVGGERWRRAKAALLAEILALRGSGGSAGLRLDVRDDATVSGARAFRERRL